MKKSLLIILSVIMAFSALAFTACGEDKIYSGHYEELTTPEAISMTGLEVSPVTFDPSDVKEKSGYELSWWSRIKSQGEATRGGTHVIVSYETENRVLAKTTLKNSFIYTDGTIKSKSTEKVSERTLSTNVTLDSENVIENDAKVYYDGVYSYTDSEYISKNSDNLSYKDTDYKLKSQFKTASNVDLAILECFGEIGEFLVTDITAVLDAAAADLTKAKVYVDKNDPTQSKLKIEFTDAAPVAAMFTNVLGDKDYSIEDKCTFIFVYNAQTQKIVAIKQALHVSGNKGSINADATILPYTKDVSIPSSVKNYYEEN